MTISNRTPSVTIAYDARGKRVTKTFDCPYEARRWYVAKLKAGKNPKVINTNTKEQ